jgi:hypothetical protein
VNIDPNLLKEMDQVILQYQAVHDEVERIWQNKMVFTWHWWLDAALAVLPWVLWLIVRDRKRTHNLLYAGLFTAFVAFLLDMTGVSQGGWNYNTLLLPFLPEYLPWDLTVMPVGAMLYYQFFPQINAWIKGLVFGVTAAYVAEPIFIWLGVYEPSNWEHHYSLPIYYAIYMIGYWLYRQSQKSNSEQSETADRGHEGVR